MRKIILMTLWVALSTLLLAAPAKTMTLAATFQGVEVGDYVHLNVKDDKGVARSFWITQDKSFTPFVEHPEKFQGQRVKLTWHKVRRNIPEAGQTMTIEEATSIELVGP